MSAALPERLEVDGLGDAFACIVFRVPLEPWITIAAEEVDKTLAAELVRRYNAHAALVDSVRALEAQIHDDLPYRYTDVHKLAGRVRLALSAAEGGAR